MSGPENRSQGPAPLLLMVRELGIGGCERDLTKIATHLDRSRFEPHVACFRPNGIHADTIRNAGIPIVHIPVESFASLSAARAARFMGRYIRKHRIGLVHTYDVPTNLFGVPVAKVYRVPAIVSSQLSYRSLRTGLGQRLLRLTDRLVTRVLVNCEAMQRHMVEDEGLDRSRTFLCYNGVDTSVFRPGCPFTKPEPLQDSDLTIGTVCALRPEKNIPLLMRAFARVENRHGWLKLAIVGSGPLLAQLESLARELNIQNRCVFQPTTDDVASWLRAMDIFVLPSLSEAFSNALLEALSTGCSVVASAVGGTPEMVLHQQTGLLFRSGDVAGLADCLQTLIHQPQLRRQLSAAGAELAHRRFSLEVAVERMSALYDELLQLNAGRVTA